MKKTPYVLILFSCLALIQIATPVSMIARREMTLRNGRQFRFRTAPVDPYDAFRGRYVALRIENGLVPVAEGVKLVRNQKVYAHIKEDKEGFAKIVSVSIERPEGDAYLQARVSRYARRNKVRLHLPFNRYYMDEKDAPAAETAYRRHSRRGRRDAYIAVRIKSGFAVIEELYVGGKPILEFIQDQQ